MCSLFNETQEALQQQTATADVLKVISRSAFDLEVGVRDADGLRRRSDAAAGPATICVRDGDVFSYRAVADGLDPAMWRYLSEHPVDPRYERPSSGECCFPAKSETIRDVLADRELECARARAGGHTCHRSACRCCATTGSRACSLVARFEPGPFDQRQIELVQTFADQAVIAIENVRLFDEVQARTRDLTEALQQQTATADVLKVISRSAFDLQAVLDTLVAVGGRLCRRGERRDLLRDGDVFSVKAVYGADDQQEFFAEHARAIRNKPGRGSIGARVALDRRGATSPTSWTTRNTMRKIEARAGNARALLGVPLLRDGESIGAFVLARTSRVPSRDARSNSSRPSPTRPSSRSRTCGCSTRCRRARATSPRRCNSRPRPPTC